VQPFVAGTQMLFQQSSAPTGWTKLTNHNDKALRIVSGTAGSSGSVPFSTLFSRTNTDNYTLTTGLMPSHGHVISGWMYGQASTDPSNVVNGSVVGGGSGNAGNIQCSIGAENQGGNGPHSHGLDMRVAYVDCIIGLKN
jgi:hypothetical protein